MSELAPHLQVLTGILAIVNPLGAIPVFLSLLGDEDERERRSAARTTAITVALVLLGAMVCGQAVLRLFGIRMASFQAGGGILIVLIAISMLHARPSRAKHTEEEAAEAAERTAVAVTPLGVPLLAGPGSIGTVILFAHQARAWADSLLLALSIVLVAAAVWGALRLASPIARLLGQTGINIATRLMGLLLVAVGVEFIARGLLGLFPALVAP